MEEAADILAGRVVPGADPDDARELLNYREAFDFVSEYLNDGGPVTERLILGRYTDGWSAACGAVPLRLGSIDESRTSSSIRPRERRSTLRRRHGTYPGSCGNWSTG